MQVVAIDAAGSVRMPFVFEPAFFFAGGGAHGGACDSNLALVALAIASAAPADKDAVVVMIVEGVVVFVEIVGRVLEFPFVVVVSQFFELRLRVERVEKTLFDNLPPLVEKTMVDSAINSVVVVDQIAVKDGSTLFVDFAVVEFVYDCCRLIGLIEVS